MTPDEIMQLRHALHAFAGRVITPGLAMAIEDAATFQQDRAIDPARFDPEWRGDYRIGVERFNDVLHELHPLHVKHWQETEKHRHGIALDPDYEAMSRAERAGRMLQFTVRHRCEWGAPLVGNLRMYLAESLHSRTLLAEEDTLYIAPEHRGIGFLPMHLLRYAERALRAVGVREIRANSKLVNRADVLMRRMGYAAVATQFVKVFHEEIGHVQ